MALAWVPCWRSSAFWNFMTSALFQKTAWGFIAAAWMLTAHADTKALKDCDRTPTFEDYPAVVGVTAGKRPVLRMNRPFARRYQTLLSGALAHAPIALAGHYVVTSFGCGTGCVMYGAVDVRSGNAWPLVDLMRLDEHLDGLQTQATSRLVVAEDFADGYSNPRVMRFYEWRGNRLHGICRRTFDR